MNNPNDKQSSLSGGEKFVAINLLSKIGVVFVIASVIAFSAASEGRVPNPARLALVLVVGLLMLGAGELFWRKGSKVFANAMIFGGAAELMICAPMGQYWLNVFNDAGMIFYSALAAAVGFLLAWRYRSQGMTIVMVAASAIPAFALAAHPVSTVFPSVDPTDIASDPSLTNAFAPAYLFLPVYLVFTHFMNSVISRRCRFDGAVFAGIGAVAVEVFVVISVLSRHDKYAFISEMIDNTHSSVFTIIFIACCGLCYSGGALLNAIEADGEIAPYDCGALCASQGVLIFFTITFLSEMSDKIIGVILLLSALLYTLAAVAFALRFWNRCKTTTVLINLILICVELSLFLLIDAGNWQYIALHSFAAALLIAGCFLERRLFTIWGYSLLGAAEIRFFGVIIESVKQPESFKLSAVFVNLILWFGVMAVLGIRKTRETAGFRLYSFAALLNAGCVCSNLISSDLMRALKHSEALANNAQRAAFSGLLCATVWMILGFIAGKLVYLNKWKAPASMVHYGIGLACLGYANIANTVSNVKNQDLVGMLVIATIIVNVVSVLAILDITLQIREKAAKFSRAVGLIVSGYAMLSLTTILGTNNVVKFTSCIISIIYLIMAAVWIVIGFWKNNPLLRRFGLALALFSSAKLFLFDFRNVDAFGKTLLFIGFGVTLLGISFGYAIMEKHLSRRENKSEPVDKQQ